MRKKIIYENVLKFEFFLRKRILLTSISINTINFIFLYKRTIVVFDIIINYRYTRFMKGNADLISYNMSLYSYIFFNT